MRFLLYLAVAAVIQLKKKPVPEPTPPATFLPKGFIIYRFNCWLCSGETAFGCMPPHQERKHNFDCCRCGIENRVVVRPYVATG